MSIGFESQRRINCLAYLALEHLEGRLVLVNSRWWVLIYNRKLGEVWVPDTGTRRRGLTLRVINEILANGECAHVSGEQLHPTDWHLDRILAVLRRDLTQDHLPGRAASSPSPDAAPAP